MRAEAGEFRPGQTVVCILTGHGLKDPDTAVADAPPVMRIASTCADLERAVFDG
jgi:threonine synthase